MPIPRGLLIDQVAASAGQREASGCFRDAARVTARVTDSAGGRRQGRRGGRTADQDGPARAPEQWARGRGDTPESAFRDRVIRSGARVRKDGPGEASGSSKRGDGTVMYSERGHKKRKEGGWASVGEGRRVRDTQIRRADTDSGVPPETGSPGRGDVGCEEGQEQIPELPR